MFKNKAPYFLGLILLSGCSSGGDGGNGAASCSSSVDGPYIGCWVTAGCQPMDNPVNNQPIWGTIQYSFATDGNIYDFVKVYANSSCTGATVFQEQDFLGLSFIDQGPEQLPSTVTAYRLTVQDVDVGAQGDSEVLAHVTNDNRLCLSNNLILDIDGYTFYFNEDATDIDFNNCLESAS